MTTQPKEAFVMQSDPTACDRTAAMLCDLGFAVATFGDEAHLYARTISVAAAPHADRSLVILAEPTADVVQDFEMLRSANWRTPLVLVGGRASPEVARHLRAACLPLEQPTAQELQRAIDAALAC